MKAKVRIPGTTANCGPGFDCVGIACTIYNYIELELIPNSNCCSVVVTGEGESTLPCDKHNIAVKAARNVLDKVGLQGYGLSIHMENNIPLARGLGSSAAAIVGGMVAANQAAGNKLNLQEIFEMATALEGHPDNVAPAIFGGITVSVINGHKPHCLRFVPNRALTMVVAIPQFILSTDKARQVLPSVVPFKDAVFNSARTGLLIGALISGEFEHLGYALEDKLHQPYRESLIPGMGDVFKAAINAGAYGATISGAGPCLIAYTDKDADKVGRAMVIGFAKNGIDSRYVILTVAQQGAIVI